MENSKARLREADGPFHDEISPTKTNFQTSKQMTDRSISFGTRIENVDDLIKLTGPGRVFIPWDRGSKGGAGKWGRLDAMDMDREYLGRLNGNVGIANGSVSGGLVAIDCDSAEFAMELLMLNNWLGETLVSQGNREQGRMTFWLEIEGKCPKTFKLGDSGQWRSDGAQTIAYGMHPNGYSYRCNGRRVKRARYEDIVWPGGIAQEASEAAAEARESKDTAIVPDELQRRRDVAQRLVRTRLRWSGAVGWGRCPWENLHSETGGNNDRNLRIVVDLIEEASAHCFHDHCAHEIERLQEELRRGLMGEEMLRPGFKAVDVSAESQAALIGEWVAAGIAMGDEKSGKQRRFESEEPYSAIFDYTAELADRSDVLLGVEWLYRGNGAILISSSGVGKSSLTMQASMHFALGLPFMGIPCERKLNILMVQAENAIRDIARMGLGITKGCEWTQEQMEEISKRLFISNISSRRNNNLIKRIEKILLDLKRKGIEIDLIVLDPAFSYIKGNVSAAEDVGVFLRDCMQPMLIRWNLGLLLIHHTGKAIPARDKDKATMDPKYMGTGSVEFTNWARATLTILSIGSSDIFELYADKRGGEIGWGRNHDGTRIRSQYIRHSREDSMIHWCEPSIAELNHILQKSDEKYMDRATWRPQELLEVLGKNRWRFEEFYAEAQKRGWKRATFKSKLRVLQDWGKVENDGGTYHASYENEKNQSENESENEEGQTRPK